MTDLKYTTPIPWSSYALKRAKVAVLLLSLAVVSAGFSTKLPAQSLENVPSLYFTAPSNVVAPLPQVIGINSTGTNFSFSASATTTTGGSWLAIAGYVNGNYSTPEAITVTANPNSLASGTYTGQITVTPENGSAKLLIPVTLTVESSSTTFFDALPGALTFSMVTSGTAPPAQPISIRNGGAGTLNWAASAITADGGSWLSLSASSGTAPSTLSVSIVPSKLPGNGVNAGTFNGEVLLQSSGGDRVTIPVIVTLGSAVFDQVNALNFTTVYGGSAVPLPQIISIGSTGPAFDFSVTAVSSTGGNWLSVGGYVNGNYSTPEAITVSANPAASLAVGIYTGEIIVYSSYQTESMIIPVTLTVESSSATFFDALPGALTFSMVTSGTAPPAQPISIRNGGAGTLNWAASATTADGGSWLSLSASSGTAPSTLSVSIVPSKLPGNGVNAGTFNGEVLLQSSGGDRVTIPVIVTLGSAVFDQVNALNFTTVYGGSAVPLPQIINIGSTGPAFDFSVTAVSSTGGNWLSVGGYVNGNYSTPEAITVSANPAASLAVGIYTGEIIVYSSYQTESMIIPVTLTVESSSATFFDALPGALTFSMVTSGTAPPAQPISIRNGGAGTLNWAASATTADGGSWLSLSASSGTAPSTLSVSIVPSKLPGNGVNAGTFNGEVLLQSSGGDRVTIPVIVTLGSAVFDQVNALNFTTVYGGSAVPLPQIINIGSTGPAFDFSVTAVSSTGGNWLSVGGYVNGNYSTPEAITVSANPAASLAVGIYTGEIIVYSSYQTESMIIPVTLTVESSSATFFDALPGALTFSMVTSGTAPPAQPISIRNGGAGTLNWAASATTADGGSWLSLSASSGTAPSTLSVSIVPSKLPGNGVNAGTFNGEVLLQSSGGDRVTIPVIVTLGSAVFDQLGAISFNKSYEGANPVSQSITVASTGSSFDFSAKAVSSTGGNWLSISGNVDGNYPTPQTIAVSANPATDLAEGIYTGQIIVYSSYQTETMIIPVSLTISSSTAHAATPVFSPAGGTFSTGQSVTITDSTPDSALHYTTDGSTPTASSPVYSKPITVAATETLKAIATATGYVQSAVGVAVYTITGPVAATPDVTQTIAISDTTPGAVLHYTTDGSTPTASSPIYTGPIVLDVSSVLKFIAIAPGYSPSAVRTVSTTIH